MQDTVRTQRAFYLGVAAMAAIVTVLRALALTLSLEPASGYFTPNAPLPLCYRILTCLTCLACILVPCLWLKGRVPVERAKPSPHSRCGAGLCALLFFLNFIAACMQKSALLPALVWLIGLLALLAATVYFTLQAAGIRVSSSATAVLGSLAILAVACLIAFTYFDVATPMNAPHKTELHVALLAVMLYLLYELRDAVGIPLPRALTACTALAFFFSATVGFSDLVATTAGVHKSPAYLAQDLLLVALAIYVGARGAADCRMPAPQATEEAPAK